MKQNIYCWWYYYWLHSDSSYYFHLYFWCWGLGIIKITFFLSIAYFYGR